MMCQEVVEVLTDYLDDALGAHDRARLEAHLAVCDGCREYLAQFRATISLAGHVDGAALPPALRAEVLRAFRGPR